MTGMKVVVETQTFRCISGQDLIRIRLHRPRNWHGSLELWRSRESDQFSPAVVLYDVNCCTPLESASGEGDPPGVVTWAHRAW